VHRPLGQQHQDGRSYVATPAAAAAATAPSAASATGSEAETGAETGAEARTETRAEARTEPWAEAQRAVVLGGLVAEVLEEFPPGMALGAMQGATLCGTGAESEAGPAGEWLFWGSEWVAHV
jgi:hypothetical protein